MIDVGQNIRAVLSAAQSPAILCSWGKDSSLLLHYVRQVKRDIPVYYFGDELPELAQQLVINDDLAVFGYAPADRYLVPMGESLFLVDEYAVNGQRVPMVSPVNLTKVSRETCPTESTARTLDFHFPHDVVLWGYRREDQNELITTVFEREIQIGHTKFVAPLYDLTTDQVLNALDVLGLDYVTDDEATLCDECLNAVINDNWDRDAALAGFRSRHFNH